MHGKRPLKAEQKTPGNLDTHAINTARVRLASLSLYVTAHRQPANTLFPHGSTSHPINPPALRSPPTHLSFPLSVHLPTRLRPEHTLPWLPSAPTRASSSPAARRRRRRSPSPRARYSSPPTAGEGQTCRLIIGLLTTDDTYAGKYDELTALFFSEEANAVLDSEFDSVKTIVYDAKNEEALVQAMSLVDTCLLIPPARKVRPLPIFNLRR